MTPIAYFWGEDLYSIERAAKAFGEELSAAGGVPMEAWRTTGDEDEADTAGGESGNSRRRARVLEGIEQRIGTATLFGGGTLVVVRQPGSLIREAASRERLIGMLVGVAPGNALCFLDLIASGGKGPAQAGTLRDAVAALGGKVQEFPALSRDRMESWIGTRAKELGATFGPGAAALLTERVGAYVREGDVDRRRMSELANAELEKLALYRPDEPITRDDVDTLVSEAVPGSTWAFLDAIGTRRSAEAATLVGRLLNEGTAMPLLITQIHRRLRDLIVIRDMVASGTKPPDIVKELRLQPYRAQKLTEQARTWDQDELDDALAALMELDLLTKGIALDGSPHSLDDGRSQLALVAWIGTWTARNSRAPAERRHQPARTWVAGTSI